MVKTTIVKVAQIYNYTISSNLKYPLKKKSSRLRSRPLPYAHG